MSTSWWDDYLDQNSPQWGPPPSQVPPTSSTPPAPTRPQNPPYHGSADNAERDYNHKQDAAGQVLFDVLDMPSQYSADMPYTSRVDANGNVIQQTVSQGLGWLRNLAYSNPEAYAGIVARLVQANYLDPSDARFNVYSNAVGEAFVEAAYDAAANAVGNDLGGAMPLTSYLDNVIEDYATSGLGPNLGGSSGSSAAPATRQDQWYDEETLKANLDDAAKNVLGRKLTDDEEAHLIGSFRSLEQTWNNDQWSATQTAEAGGNISLTNRPNPSAVFTDDAIEENPGTQQEAGEVRIASYVNSMRNMLGLGTGGVVGAVG